jgi:hypothetical protein
MDGDTESCRATDISACFQLLSFSFVLLQSFFFAYWVDLRSLNRPSREEPLGLEEAAVESFV